MCAVHAQALAAARAEVPPHEVDEIFRQMDADGDGEISQAEFEAAFYAARLAGTPHSLHPRPVARPQQWLTAPLTRLPQAA